MQAEHSVINISGDNGVATHWSVSYTYIIFLLPIEPLVILRREYSTTDLFSTSVGAFNKTLVISLMSHPVVLIFQNIN